MNRIVHKLQEFLELEKIANRFFFKRDGSLDNGFEIVSHPFTLSYSHEHLRFNKILDWLQKEKYTSFEGNRCGLHVHVSREFFEEEEITRLRLFFARNKKVLYNFSKREGVNPITGRDYCKYESWQVKRILKNTNPPQDHYWALNAFTCPETIEFRLFRGCLDHHRFLAYLQFVEAISWFVKKIGTNSLIIGEKRYSNSSWLLFLDWLKQQHKYEHLLKTIKQDNLLSVLE